MQENAMFFQEINNFLKIIRETISFKLESLGQNYFSGLHAKKLGEIFFQPKLLDPKHSAYHNIKIPPFPQISTYVAALAFFVSEGIEIHFHKVTENFLHFSGSK